jgi:ribosomal protein S18 acetylase RimI-like enzyme
MSAVFRLGRRDDAEVLTDLLCSARREIGLDDHVCSAEKRDDLVKWIREKCYYSSVWTTDEHEALAVLNRCANTKSICGIRHIVVRSDSRRKGIGTAIVRHIQNLGGVTSLIVEAHNPASEKMLRGTGFVENSARGFPIRMNWSRF